MKKLLSFLWETFKIVVIALAIVIPIRYFLFQPFFVKGASMEPNFDDGQYLIIDELSYRFRQPERGEIIVFKYPHDTSQRYIKRIIGLPGETVEIKDEEVLVNGQILNESSYLPEGPTTSGFTKIILSENDYFVLGDNRLHSSDSRSWGSVPKENIVGRAYLRAWPFTVWDKFEAPTYSY